VLQGATVPVICVPPQYEPLAEMGPLPRVGRVLASTDFSEHGDRATRMAYASLPTGGVVRLVHVVERAVTNPVYAQYGIGNAPKGDEELARSRLGEHLRSLVPPEADERGIRTEVEVIESKDAAAAIAQAAERFGADVICMGSHGRAGLGKTLVGSVTQGVIARTRRPVLVVKPPEA
jgi:nucleotide-binding universal stress UspA family protein